MKELIKNIDAIFENGLINSCINIALVFIFISIMNRFLNQYLKKKYDTNLRMAMRFKKTILIFIMIWAIFAQIIPLQSLAKTLLASGGILAVVIGLASQEAASNIINGVMIYTYKPYKVTDFISIKNENVVGTVLDITLRHTVIETLEKTQVIVPNRIMNNATIENVSNVPDKKANYLYLEIAYESDIDKAIALIQAVATQHPAFIDPRNAQEKINNPLIPVLCTNLLASGIELRATIYSIDNGSGFLMLSDLRLAILKAFREENIEIPYPHVTLQEKKHHA